MGFRAEEVAETIVRATRIDAEWRRKVPEDDRRYTPWMPFQLARFITLLAESVAGFYEVHGRPAESFCEVGCGPGSKLLVARDMFGLDAQGIERVDETAGAARSLGLTAITADAMAWRGYRNCDIIWLNRPARDPELERAIERKIFDKAAPGSVVMCANLEQFPQGWWPVVDDTEERAGAWLKPLVAPGTRT